MPRPIQGAQLIKLREGEPDFMRGDWWSTFKEARVFYPLGFPDVMATLNLYSVDELIAVAAEAIANIRRTNWPVQLRVRGHWEDCVRAQMKYAAGAQPMLLPKAAIAIEALQIIAGPSIDVYEEVPIIAAASGVVGLSLEDMLKEKGGVDDIPSERYTAFIDAARSAGQNKPDLLLRDMVKGHYATTSVCEIVKSTFDNYHIQIIQTYRPGKQGVKQASEFLTPI